MRTIKIIAATLSLGFAIAYGSHSAMAGSTDTGSRHVVEADSASLAALSSRLEEYFAALISEPIGNKCKEADFIIETCTDSLIRQHVALKIYSHYLDSGIMGEEAVAVHVTDKWFASGKIKMKTPIDLMNARIFAEFNRNSLIGMKAPELALQDASGELYSIFGAGSDGSGSVLRDDALTSDAEGLPGAAGRYSVLYFYDTDCSKCKIESILLRNVLENSPIPIDLYAIYTQSDYKAWQKYAKENLSLRTDKTDVRVYDLWDPDFDSDFQRKYGILQTPGIFLIDPEGRIAGRRLDSHALDEMLDIISVPKEMEYGSDESAAFYDKVFGQSPDCSVITDAIDRIRKRTLPQDTLLFKQMAGDLLYYLSGQRGSGYRCGLGYLTRKHILSDPDIWNTPDDTLKIIDFASIMSDLQSRGNEGTEIPSVSVYATLKRQTGSRIRTINLARLRGKKNIIIFHTEGCNICKEEIAAADALLKDDKDIQVLLVDMDLLLSSHPPGHETFRYIRPHSPPLYHID